MSSPSRAEFDAELAKRLAELRRDKSGTSEARLKDIALSAMMEEDKWGMDAPLPCRQCAASRGKRRCRILKPPCREGNGRQCGSCRNAGGSTPWRVPGGCDMAEVNYGSTRGYFDAPPDSDEEGKEGEEGVEEDHDHEEEEEEEHDHDHDHEEEEEDEHEQDIDESMGLNQFGQDSDEDSVDSLYADPSPREKASNEDNELAGSENNDLVYLGTNEPIHLDEHHQDVDQGGLQETQGGTIQDEDEVVEVNPGNNGQLGQDLVQQGNQAMVLPPNSENNLPTTIDPRQLDLSALPPGQIPAGALVNTPIPPQPAPNFDWDRWLYLVTHGIIENCPPPQQDRLVMMDEFVDRDGILYPTYFAYVEWMETRLYLDTLPLPNEFDMQVEAANAAQDENLLDFGEQWDGVPEEQANADQANANPSADHLSGWE